MTLQDKYQALLDNLRAIGPVAVAFSGGVDSTLLLHAAREALGEKAVAITAVTRVLSASEREEAAEFCRSRGIEQLLCHVDELAVEGFRDNPPNRCYICKRALFTAMQAQAAARGATLVEGSNLDDEGDYRPGLTAIRELGVPSPLRAAQLHKDEIRALSHSFGLPTWNKPSLACLASRIPYGEEITAEKLALVEQGEAYLRALGFGQLRLRLHGTLARIEVPPEDFPRLMARREEIYQTLRALGLSYVALDLGGYRTGSLNEVLAKKADNPA